MSKMVLVPCLSQSSPPYPAPSCRPGPWERVRAVPGQRLPRQTPWEGRQLLEVEMRPLTPGLCPSSQAGRTSQTDTPSEPAMLLHDSDIAQEREAFPRNETTHKVLGGLGCGLAEALGHPPVAQAKAPKKRKAVSCGSGQRLPCCTHWGALGTVQMLRMNCLGMPCKLYSG